MPTEQEQIKAVEIFLLGMLQPIVIPDADALIDPYRNALVVTEGDGEVTTFNWDNVLFFGEKDMEVLR